MACYLCGEERQLLRMSHIIPDFMYRVVFDDRHRYRAVSLEDEKNSRLRQTGYFDQNILCATCDNVLLGRLEDYACGVLYGGNAKHPISVESQISKYGTESFVIGSIQYTRFKLFILSILWRAHISKQPFFSRIDIGELEPVIRKMLLEGNPGEEQLFRMSIVRLNDIFGNPIPMTVGPQIKKQDGIHLAHFFIEGMAYFIELTPDSNFMLFPRYALKATGQIEIPLLDGRKARSMLKSLGISEDFANYHTLRIYRVHGDPVARAEQGFCEVLIHGCNCFKNVKNGISPQMVARFGCDGFPLENPKLRGDKNKLGKIDYRIFPMSGEYRGNLTVVNAYVQFTYNGETAYDYETFTQCMQEINRQFPGKNIGLPVNKRVLLSGVWNRLAEIIDTHLKDCRITVFIYSSHAFE